ncbi:hypothetical protein M758_4G235500 [Ceratodon purpureus]|nr:hypothetical protein M758_4G235500 [Ceratodon purpureus]
MGVQVQHDLSSQEGLRDLDQYLSSRAFISGYQASRDDLAVFVKIHSVPAEFQSLSRWYNHILELLGAKFGAPGVGVHIESGDASCPSETVAPQTPAAEADSEAAAPAEAEEDDDDLDLFAEETEEEKAASEKREAEKKASGKPKVAGKSSIVLDIKPWDDETDMTKLEECVRAVQMPGLHWGASKLVTVVTGIKKLQIMMTIEDDLVSIDNLIEDFLTSEPNNEYIQSCDIVAFNKI